MSKKKQAKRPAHNKKNAPAKKSGPNKLIIAGIAVVAVIGAVIALSGGGAGSSAGSEYAGRFLPQAYASPSVSDPALYTSPVTMTPIIASQDQGLSVALADVASSKIVRFDYARPDGSTLPMLAYVRPSGKLFVGVDYCPPCEGEGQRIEADGTLTCESCGTKRNLEDNSGLSGACKLYPLDEVPASVQGDRIVIDTGVLDTWTAQPLDRPIG